MPTLEWLKYGALGLGLALAACSFLLVRRALKASRLDTGRVLLLIVCMVFALLLAGAAFTRSIWRNTKATLRRYMPKHCSPNPASTCAKKFLTAKLSC